jgi:hypothetical protein
MNGAPTESLLRGLFGDLGDRPLDEGVFPSDLLDRGMKDSAAFRIADV